LKVERARQLPHLIRATRSGQHDPVDPVAVASHGRESELGAVAHREKPEAFRTQRNSEVFEIVRALVGSIGLGGVAVASHHLDARARDPTQRDRRLELRFERVDGQRRLGDALKRRLREARAALIEQDHVPQLAQPLEEREIGGIATEERPRHAGTAREEDNRRAGGCHRRAKGARRRC